MADAAIMARRGLSGINDFNKKICGRPWPEASLNQQRFREDCQRLRCGKSCASSILALSDILKKLLFGVLAHVSNNYGRHSFCLLTSGLGGEQRSILAQRLSQLQATNG